MADTPRLGCIADDFTGATDLASQLVSAGMRVVQTIGVPAAPLEEDCDAVVVSLKSRTIAPGEAVRQSLDALRWLQTAGCERFFFKYCSTFDSTPDGNIGPGWLPASPTRSAVLRGMISRRLGLRRAGEDDAILGGDFRPRCRPRRGSSSPPPSTWRKTRRAVKLGRVPGGLIRRDTHRMPQASGARMASR